MPDLLTNRHLQTAKPGAELADSVARGLRFRVSGKGRRSFYYRYRSISPPEAASAEEALECERCLGKMARDGESARCGKHDGTPPLVRVAIGSYADSKPPQSLAQARAESRYTLEQARQECAHLRQLRGQGVDPQTWKRQGVARRQAENAAEQAQADGDGYMMADLCRDWLRAKHADWRVSTERGNTRIVNAEILPRWGKRPVSNLRRGEIAEARDAVKAKGGTLSNRWLWCIKALLDFAVEREIIDANPAAAVKRKHRETPRERYLSRGELSALIRGLPVAQLRDDFRDLLHLLLLTGVRNSEACGAMAEEIDFEGQTWTLPKIRTKAKREHRVLLSAQALSLLERRVAQGPRDGRLFPKPKGLGCLDANDVGKRVRALVSSLGMKDWTAHDLRATMATHLAEMGYPPEITDERMLSHAVRGIRRHYDFATRDEPAREAWQKWANYLDSPSDENVVALKRKEANGIHLTK